jgi:hypothetical protein
MTNSQRSLAKAVRMSSATPSPKYSWSGSPDELAKGRTAIEGLSGRESVGLLCWVPRNFCEMPMR